jgi:RHS repeat-associated protein
MLRCDNSDLAAVNDYYAFGSPMEGRTYTGTDYRFGFNGQEKEDDIYGEGNTYSAEYWMYDSRLGRRWNVDPVDQISISNYAVLSNSPIIRIDPYGDDDFSVDEDGGVTWVGPNDEADNYYDIGDGEISYDEDGNISNDLITSTEAGSLQSIKRKGYTYLDENGEEKIVPSQTLDFGDNEVAAEKVFKAVARYSKKEFSYARYNSNQGKQGKNMVYTSFNRTSDIFGTEKSLERKYELVIHKHFHPAVPYHDRYNPSPTNSASPEDYTGDIGFARFITAFQEQKRTISKRAGKDVIIPTTRFYIVTDRDTDIEYNQYGKISE